MHIVAGWALAAIWTVLAVLTLYLYRVNQLLSGTPDEVRKLAGERWTPDQLRETYKRLQDNPIDYTDKLPPKLDRRYVVTGGSGECLLPTRLRFRRLKETRGLN